jgi:ribose transport system permease protein
MDALNRIVRSEELRRSMPVITLAVLAVIIGARTPQFLSVQTLLVVAGDTATLFILALGVTFVILIGGIDLSIQSVASLASVVVALTLTQSSLGYLAFVFATLTGTAAGLVSGFAHVRLKIPSFIATLAVGGIAAGIALIISGARAIELGEAQRGYLAWVAGVTLGIPHEVIIGAVALLLALFVLRFTLFGRYIQAIGAGEAAAYASGIDVARQKIVACALSGSFAGFAGGLLSARLASGSPTLADQQLLPAIAAVVVGGTAITGGIGGAGRTLIGALIVSVVRIGMTFFGVDIFAQNIVFGAVLVLAVAATIDRSKIPIIK